jgi:hypothetical protein
MTNYHHHHHHHHHQSPPPSITTTIITITTIINHHHHHHHQSPITTITIFITIPISITIRERHRDEREMDPQVGLSEDMAGDPQPARPLLCFLSWDNLALCCSQCEELGKRAVHLAIVVLHYLPGHSHPRCGAFVDFVPTSPPPGSGGSELRRQGTFCHRDAQTWPWPVQVSCWTLGPHHSHGGTHGPYRTLALC